MRIAFVGPTYPLESKPASVQQTVNMYPVPIETQNERVTWVFKDMPGLVEATTFAPAATETVLFLFHMTETATAEGIAEFTGPTAANDQTGATWAANNTNWLLPASSPSPKFGLFSFGHTGAVTWSRDFPQSNPSVLDDFSTASATTLQIDGWLRRDSDGGGTQSCFIDVGADSYPFNTYFRMGIDSSRVPVCGFESSDEETFVAADYLFPNDTWTHLRLLVVGNAGRLYVDGVSLVTFTTEAGTPIVAAGPINLCMLSFSSSGMYLDEVRAALGVSSDTANFTPPVAPWPNPA